MNLEIAFKRLILVDFAMIILVTLSAFVAPVNEELPFSSIDAIALALLVIYLVSLYLLYTFRPLGKILYAPVFIFSIGVGVGYPLEYINPQNYFDLQKHLKLFQNYIDTFRHPQKQNQIQLNLNFHHTLNI